LNYSNILITFRIGEEKMAHRDGITNVLVYWDNKDAFFVAGTQLSGRIEVTNRRQTTD
jgi:hypothetical protein